MAAVQGPSSEPVRDADEEVRKKIEVIRDTGRRRKPANGNPDMNPQRPHGDIEDLLGVYALDMLDVEEHEVVDRHLAGCRTCAKEAAEHREAASLLTPGGPPPPAIWNRITAALEEAP